MSGGLSDASIKNREQAEKQEVSVVSILSEGLPFMQISSLFHFLFVRINKSSRTLSLMCTQIFNSFTQMPNTI